MARVSFLRHVGVAAPNFEEAVTFYQDGWGLTKVEHDSGIAYFRAEGSPENFILRIRKAPEKRIDLIALGADDAASVDELASSLAQAGVRFVSEPDTLKTPGGGYGFRFFDPDGRVIEVSSDVEARPYREIEDREAIPVKLSHVVLNATNSEESIAFYQEKLGFKISDVIIGGLTFMRCSPDHHGVGIGPGTASRLNHIAFEMKGIDEQFRASGRVFGGGSPLQRGMIRNLLGDNVSSYFWDPNGNVAEYTCEVEQIPIEGGRDPRYVTREDNKEQWGFMREPDTAPESALTPETGYWVAPPV